MQYKLWRNQPGLLGLVSLLVLATASCDSPPADPEGTLERLRGGTLRVGATENDPWVTLHRGEPGGVEVRLLKALAAELDADIEWTFGSEQELFGALQLGQLDVVIGGIVSDNPYSQHAALTHPYATSQIVVGVPPQQDIEDIAGLEVAVERDSQAAGVLEKTDAVPSS